MGADHITAENLSFELKVGVALLDGPASLTELAQRMGDLEMRVVGRGLDVLFDQGQVKDEWQRREDGRHVKRIMLCDVAKPFFEKVREHVKENRTP